MVDFGLIGVIGATWSLTVLLRLLGRGVVAPGVFDCGAAGEGDRDLFFSFPEIAPKKDFAVGLWGSLSGSDVVAARSAEQMDEVGECSPTSDLMEMSLS